MTIRYIYNTIKRESSPLPRRRHERIPERQLPNLLQPHLHDRDTGDNLEPVLQAGTRHQVRADADDLQHRPARHQWRIESSGRCATEEVVTCPPYRHGNPC